MDHAELKQDILQAELAGNINIRMASFLLRTDSRKRTSFFLASMQFESTRKGFSKGEIESRKRFNAVWLQVPSYRGITLQPP